MSQRTSFSKKAMQREDIENDNFSLPSIDFKNSKTSNPNNYNFINTDYKKKLSGILSQYSDSEKVKLLSLI